MGFFSDEESINEIQIIWSKVRKPQCQRFQLIICIETLPNTMYILYNATVCPVHQNFTLSKLWVAAPSGSAIAFSARAFASAIR